MEHKNIIFFDGICGLCNGLVDFIIPRDKKNKFKFSPLQSKTALEILDSKYIENLDTIVLYSNEIIYTKSDAVLRILSLLGLPYSFLLIFKVVPTILRDLIYKLISSNRYVIFGKKQSCRLPSEDEKLKFLP